MNKNIPSIRSQLILNLIVPLTLLSLITLTAMWFLIGQMATKVFDRSLLAAASSIEQRLGISGGKTILKMPYFVLDIMESASGEKIFYRIERSDGEILAGFAGLAMPEKSLQKDQPLFYSIRFAGNDLRAVYLRVAGKTSGGQAYTQIVLAESLQGRKAFSEDFLTILAIVTLLGVILSTITAVLAVNQGLSPLRKIRNSLLKRSLHDLAPINASVPKEIKELIFSINQLMARLREGIEHMQHFNSDVSHQLRTPLAEIKTLTELAATESDSLKLQQSFCKIGERVDFLARTTQQLLSYAKTNKNILDDSHLITLNLTQLCRQVSSNLAPAIYKKGQQLEFVAEQNQEINIVGDPIMLTGLLSNLIENASMYALDAKGNPLGIITVRVLAKPGFACIEVQDQGPGIAEEQLALVTQRFYRLDNQFQGSGLGLAIVKQISDFHQAYMQLSNVKPQGFKVAIKFKRELNT